MLISDLPFCAVLTILQDMRFLRWFFAVKDPGQNNRILPKR